MKTFASGLQSYLDDVKDAESLVDPFKKYTYHQYGEYIQTLLKGRLSLFIDRVDEHVGVCDVVTTCGVRKTQPIGLLKTFPSYKKGFHALLEQFRPLNVELLKRYWELPNIIAHDIVNGKIELVQIDFL